jgi:hypothetical protein
VHETLIEEWRRAMATRAAIATLLFVIPACVAAYVQLGGSVAGLPTGLASLAGGPSAESVDSGPGTTLSEAVGGIVDLVSGSGDEARKSGRDSTGGARVQGPAAPPTGTGGGDDGAGPPDGGSGGAGDPTGGLAPVSETLQQTLNGLRVMLGGQPAQ